MIFVVALILDRDHRPFVQERQLTSQEFHAVETVNGILNRFEDKIAWVLYFNAGVRVVDLSDPYDIKEVGYYILKS